MANFTYRGYKCCYSEFRSEESSKSIILIPDDGQPGYSVQEILSYMPTGYRMVLVDFLGCGDSDKPSGFVSDLWTDQAMQLKELFYQTGYEHAVLIGFGEGGCRTAEAFLQEMPERVERVICTAKSYVSGSLPKELRSKIMMVPSSMHYLGDLQGRSLGLACRQLLQGDETRCPYCGGIMMRGKIVGGRDLSRWTMDDGLYAGGYPGAGEFYLRNLEPKGFLERVRDPFNEDRAQKTAYVCYDCGKMVADIGMNIRSD
ncbi:MAG: alpha/beta hydrolase [Firmicutes bacterium]|nr:alpha/beta hydrolase [Bacillota bacterium]